MPNPIAPATPTITQGQDLSTLNDTSPGIETVQAVMDRIYPMKGGVKLPEPPKLEQKPAEPPSKPDISPSKQAEPPSKTPDAATSPPKEETGTVEDKKMPSFLEEALKPESKPAEVKAIEEEWSDELPQAEKQSRVKGLRDAYKKVKAELETIKSRPAADEAAQARLQALEAQNKEQSTILSRLGVEQNQEFQNQVIRPLYGAWNEAARIVKDAGKDPNDLAKAMSLSGKSQFEALDELFTEMPESAKAEAHDALREYRKFEKVRQNALANAPQTFEALQKKELERQYQALTAQKEDMKSRFDNAIKRLRDDAKLEVLQRSKDPDTEWWNEQADGIENAARSLYLENSDMDKMAMACVIAPAVDAYRKLWLSERAARSKVEKTLKDKFGAEPSLSESSGSNGNMMPSQQMQEDLKQPFQQVFLREFHKAQARNR